MKKLLNLIIVVVGLFGFSFSSNCQVLQNMGFSFFKSVNQTTSLEEKFKESMLTKQEQVSLMPKEGELVEKKPITNKLSVLEKEIKERFSEYLDEELFQIGYDFFKEVKWTITHVGDDYVLGPGDVVKVMLSGPAVDVGVVQSEYLVEIKGDGKVYIPPLGSLFVSGLSLKDFKRVLNEELGKKFKEIRVEAMVHSLRAFNIYVTGFVEQPGMIMVTSLDTLVSALTKAGGVKKEGSLRRIVLRQRKEGEVKESFIDLYDLLVRGQPIDIVLKDGDVIYVPPIGPTVAIAGQVKKPGIYEVKDEKTFKEVVEMAGGLLPFALIEKIKVLRVEREGVKVFEESFKEGTLLQELRIRDGDLLIVGKITKDLKGVIFISGEVEYPGFYSLQETPCLKLLLEKVKLKETANFQVGRIIHKDGRIEQFVPQEVLEGKADLNLKDGDRIFIPSLFARFPIYVFGEVKFPKLIPYYDGLTLLEALRDVEFKGDPKELKAVVYRYKEKPVERYLYDLLILSKENLDLPLEEGANVAIQRILPIEKRPKVKILGEVLKPGEFELKPNTTLYDFLKEVGLTEKAYLKGLILIRQSVKQFQKTMLETAILAFEENLLRMEEESKWIGEEERQLLGKTLQERKEYLSLLKKKAEIGLGRIALDIPEDLEMLKGNPNNLLLEDGDTIIVPSLPGYVLLLGDIHNPVALPYVPGKSVKDYLDEIGGGTKSADLSGVYVIKSNGKVVSSQTFSKFFFPRSILAYKPERGDAIIVPPKIKVPVLWRPLLKDVVQIIFQSISTAVMAKEL
jgi:protein involved in polysaccharide export with SLBB domain